MNYRFVLNQLGLLLTILSAILLLVAGAFFSIQSWQHHAFSRNALIALLVSGGAGLVVGVLIWMLARSGRRHLGRREAMLLVASSWFLGAAFSALPYYLWALLGGAATADHPFGSFVDCYFEAMSGLTTTGATVLGSAPNDIESVPRSLLLSRAITHWLGGLGIVVLFVAVLPTLGVGGKRLFRVEAPGPAPEGLQPQIRETARVLWFIYVGLTVAQTLALWRFGLGEGMSFYDAFCHTCATLATGGFSTRNASVGAYGLIDRIVVVVFMVLAGVNFGLYYRVIRGRASSVIRDVELQFYLFLLLAGSVLVFLALSTQPTVTMTTGEQVAISPGVAASEAIFTTVSIQTTTGFCTSDFNRWPFLAQAALVLLMFVGGCSGSTGGGIKVIRVWLALRIMLAEIERVFRPNVIRPVRVGGRKVEEELKLTTLSYVLGIILLFAAGSGAIMLLEQTAGNDCTYTTAATASVATLCTIGPGLGRVGAVESYGWMSEPSKLVLCVLMALGRLEVFAIVVLFSSRFWKAD